MLDFCRFEKNDFCFFWILCLGLRIEKFRLLATNDVTEQIVLV